MKPTNSAYKGYWGTYEGGLGFTKTFCAEGVSSTRCAEAAARQVVATLSTKALIEMSGWNDIRAATLDFLCPNTSDDVRRNECFASLPAAAAATGSGSYSPFRGTTLKCSVRGCDYQDVCKTDANDAPIPGTCVRKAASNANPREYVEEYRLILAGFAHLKGESSPAPAPTFP